MHREFLITIVACIWANVFADPIKTTAERVRSHGYSVEEHTVQTSDNYILKMFRMPGNRDVSQKPVMFLLHGLLSSSDAWILSGPNDALAYLLADAGYDVWMGNCRGNTYSKNHTSKSPLDSSFWEFSWNEIGIYDLPAMIDYVLDVTHEDALHYVGYSQGTTAFLVLLSSIPSYNQKIKTSHLLAPVGYIDHASTLIIRSLAPVVGKPSLISEVFDGHEFLPNEKLLSTLGAEACAEKAVIQEMCANVFILIGGLSDHMNNTLLPELLETQPAGASTSQIVHYVQEHVSGHFRNYDFGKCKNEKVYGQVEPPDYQVENIQLDVPIEFYYGNTDSFVAVVDAERMIERLGRNARAYHIEYSTWNHLDYMFALEVKKVINDHVIDLANSYERR